MSRGLWTGKDLVHRELLKIASRYMTPSGVSVVPTTFFVKTLPEVGASLMHPLRHLPFS